MKSIEFMYWLQGSFEICESAQLTDEQVVKIKNHLKMVEITDGKQLWPFCSWLQGFFVALEDKTPTVSQTNLIKNKLNGIFDHIVDRTLQEKEYNSNNGHAGSYRLPPGVVAKC